MPIKGPTKTFEQLLEEQLANEEQDSPLGGQPSKKKPVKFLKRGEGLSRFNLKENITPQKEYKPSTKNRQPLVDYSKPVLKPRAKEPETKQKTITKPSAKPKQAQAPSVARKVASVTHSPSKSTLRRSNTMPARKPDQKPNTQTRRLSNEQPPNAAALKQKSPHTNTRIAKPGGGTPTSPRKYLSSQRPQSAMEMTQSHIAKPSSSPTKKLSSSPSKQSTPLTSKPSTMTAMPSVTTAPLSGTHMSQSVDAKYSIKKPVDSSFYSNIQNRVENEGVETEELEVT